MGFPIVHFEVVGPDGVALQKFYSELFGWHIQNNAEMGNYGLVDTHGGGGINGGVGDSQDGSAQVTIYVGTPTIQQTLDKAIALGATLSMDVMVIPDVVTMAQFTDPQGNVIGLVETPEGEQAPPIEQGDGAPVAWFEIMGPDSPALHRFYGELFGWSFPQVHEQFGNYGIVDTGVAGAIQGGIGTSQDGSARVTVYANVADLQKTLERATTLGATTVLEPHAVDEKDVIAMFADPQGNIFGIMTQTR